MSTLQALLHYLKEQGWDASPWGSSILTKYSLQYTANEGFSIAALHISHRIYVSGGLLTAVTSINTNDVTIRAFTNFPSDSKPDTDYFTDVELAEPKAFEKLHGYLTTINKLLVDSHESK